MGIPRTMTKGGPQGDILPICRRQPVQTTARMQLTEYLMLPREEFENYSTALGKINDEYLKS